jgi:hypothetical protein
VAGLDELAGGSWLGVNDEGMVAAVLNRRGTLGPSAGKRSRGELVLDALDHAEAYMAAEALVGLDPGAYRPFNLVVADPVDAFIVRHGGDGPIRIEPVPEGVSLLEAGELNDPRSRRTARFLPLFRTARAPDPTSGDWSDWQALLADRSSEGGDPREAMCVVTEGPYGTRSASLLALPRYPTEPSVWLHADGRPGETAWEPVALWRA